MPKLDAEELEKKRWLRAIEIAKVLFLSEGYFDDYLCQIEEFIKEKKKEDKEDKEEEKDEL